MKSIAFLIMPFVLLLVGCQTSAKFSCAGWTKPPPINEPAQLVKTEPQLTKWLVTTSRFGTKQSAENKAALEHAAKNIARTTTINGFKLILLYFCDLEPIIKTYSRFI